jgi:hypothetical protein
MKKLLIISLVLLLCAPALAVKRTDAVDSRDTIERTVGNLAGLGTGKEWYVDSGASGAATGTNWTDASLTLEAAVNLSTADSGASRGDRIHVAQGHAETLTGADAVDVDVIGISVIGYGRGSLMPTFTFLLAADEFVVGADNIGLSNLRFEVSSSSITTVLDIQDGVDYAHIKDCVFTCVDAADGAVNFINLVNNNTGCIIEDCTFDSKAGGAAESAIMLDADTDQTVIRNNLIQGDYSVACIEGDTTKSTELLIQGNFLVNGSSDSIIGEPAIDLLTGTTGYILDNYLVCNVATVSVAMETADTVMLFNNWYNEDVGVTKSGSPWHVGSFGGTLMNSVSASGDD